MTAVAPGKGQVITSHHSMDKFFEVGLNLNVISAFGRKVRAVKDPAADVRSLVADRLEGVEELFSENLASPVGIVREIGSFVSEGEGKRVRPTLHLLCSSLCRYEGKDDILIATVLEFIHSATLIHDDVIDEARTRRGRDSINERWGNNVTVLFGDYMLAKAMEMALRVGSLAVMERLADVTLRMTEGEMLQTRYVGRIDLTEEEYLDLVERKTAALFACCCELAGILAGVDAERAGALRRYGLNLGLAFQLVDDLLDYTGDAATLGKPAATDLREGKVTLALIGQLEQGSGEARDLAERIMTEGRPEMPEIARLSALLRKRGAIDKTYDRARMYAEAAAKELKMFEDSPSRRALQSLPDLLLFRVR